ncbi:MAG: patatin-like phospholipase family protein [Holosporales bacterium]|jgi:NTE family protein|nr:patatin-like phospholipase family protein [Holosporales bacterium]
MIDKNNENCPRAQTAPTNKPVAVALQGGGIHGAFTCGILCGLLEDERLDITSVSGTSAGAMNAAALVQGLTQNGRAGAQAFLRRYWQEIAEVFGAFSPCKSLYKDKKAGDYNLDHSPSFLFAGMVQSFFSPYELNPLGINPFFEFLSDFFDFDALNQSDIDLHISTTDVEAGKIKVWTNGEISADVLLASSCLPCLSQAVKINDRFYWDGGFLANPAIFPLINNAHDAARKKSDAEERRKEQATVRDIIVIPLTRQTAKHLPTTNFEIQNRLTEITLNGCLVREMRAIHLITKLIDDGVIKQGSMQRCNIHIIKNDKTFEGLNSSSSCNMDEDFVAFLYEEGYKTAETWLKNHFSDLGTPKSVDCGEHSVFDDFV